MTNINETNLTNPISMIKNGLKNKPLPTIAILVFVSVIASLAILRTSEIISRASANIDDHDISKAINVKTITARQIDSYQTIQYITGQVIAARESDHGFDRAGILAEVMVDEGDRVEKGQILAKLDTRKLEAQKIQTQANLTSALAQATEADVNLARAEAAYNRYNSLKENGHISQHRLDQATNDLASAVSRQASSQSGIKSAEAAMAGINAEIDLSILHAQFDGSVVSRYRDEGSAFGMGGGPMIRLIEDSKLEIRLGITENAAAGMIAGKSYTFKQGNKDITATLRSLLAKVDQNTRTITAIFDLDKIQNVRPGSLVELAVKVEINESGYWLPTEALAESRRGLWTAYTLKQIEGRSDINITSRQELQVIYTEADRVFVRGTLKDGDKVVSSGTHRLSAGFIVIAN